MKDKGIRNFQEERSSIIINLINQSCSILLKKEINISGKSVTLEIIKLFKKENIKLKYLVSEQTISRTTKYNSIWKEFKKKQNERFYSKQEKKNKELSFSLRDKYDMLKQDYIELYDQYNLIFNVDINKKESNKESNERKDINIFKDDAKNFLIETIDNIKNLLKNGSVIIVEKDDVVIIKNMNLKDTHKIIIDKDKWNNL